MEFSVIYIIFQGFFLKSFIPKVLKYHQRFHLLQSESLIFTLLQIREFLRAEPVPEITTIIWMFLKVLSYRTCCIFHKRKDMSWSITSSACYSALISSLLSQQKLHYCFIVKGFIRRYTRNCYGRDFKATDSTLHINI